jgi:hypothetical protein
MTSAQQPIHRDSSTDETQYTDTEYRDGYDDFDQRGTPLVVIGLWTGT